MKERPDIGVYVKDLSGYVVNNADDLDRIMIIGNKNRVIGATAMNVASSRSHAIFTITVESSQIGEDGQQHVKMGKLHLVDLAVSILTDYIQIIMLNDSITNKRNQSN